MIKQVVFRSSLQPVQLGWNPPTEVVDTNALKNNRPYGNAVNFPANLSGKEVVINPKAIDVMQVFHPSLATIPAGKFKVVDDKIVNGVRMLDIIDPMAKIETANAAFFDVL